VRELRVQIRVALALVAVLTLLFWTVPYFMEDHREPIQLVWLVHTDAKDISALEKAPERSAELAPKTAFSCGAKDLDIYLGINGLQSVYWKEPLDRKIEDCLRGDNGVSLRLIRNQQYGPSFRPPYVEGFLP
jgi:hypothetical protein